MALTKESVNQQLLSKGYSQSAIDNYWSSVDSGTDAKDAAKTLKNSLNTPVDTSSSLDTNKNKTGSNSGLDNYSSGTDNSSKKTGTSYTGIDGNTYNKSELKTSVANTWNSKSYEEQKKLWDNPQYRQALTNAGLTLKRQDVDTESANQYNVNEREAGTKPQQSEEGWDYQSTDEARTQEIINNLDWYKVNQPQLFSDYETFKAAFIDGKGRSAEQEAILNNYFYGQQKLQKYNSMSAEDIAGLYVNGQISDSDLSMIANTDPNKYAQIQAQIKVEKDKIGNNSYYDSLLTQNGFEAFASSKGFVDKDGNGVYDVYDANYKKTDQEIEYENEASNLNSEILDLQRQKRKVLDDLIEQYPGVPLSTLNVMASDMASDLDDLIYDKSVRLNTLNGYISTLQEDRELQIKGAQQTLESMEKLYGMYYDYTPEGISSMASMKAEAEYAATNITLSQADTGSYTQKQMALESVLTPIYEQYGSIIQRSQAQVVNDIINYAQEKGIGLEQAFNENFMNYLKDKPAYKQIQSQLANAEPNLQTIGYDSNGKAIQGYWDSDTKSFVPVSVGGLSGTGSLGGGSLGGGNGGDTVSSFESLLSQEGYSLGSVIREGGCGTVVNDYLKSLGEDIRLIEANKIKPYATSKTAMEGGIAYFDGSQSWATDATKNHGHVAIVKSVNNDGTITVLESNVGTGLRYATYKQSDVTGYYNPKGIMNNPAAVQKATGVSYARAEGIQGQNNKFSNTSSWNSNGYHEDLISEYKKYLENPSYEGHTDLEYKLGGYGMSFADFVSQAQNYGATTGKQNGLNQASTALESATKLYQMLYSERTWKGKADGFSIGVDSPQSGPIDFFGQRMPGSPVADAKTEYDTLIKRLQLNALTEAKKAGATFGAMSDSEWDILGSASTDLNWNRNSGEEFRTRLESLIYSLQDSIVQGGGQLPSNYANSLASQYVYKNQKSLDAKYHTTSTSKGLGSSRMN